MTSISISTEPCIGELIAKRFQLKRLLGRGGMGSVYYAEDTVQKGQSYAIKFLAGNLAEESQVKRFSRSAGICAQLGKKSSHVVQVMACGMHADRMSYYVMEYLEGQSLKDILQKQSLSLSRFFSLCYQICFGLQVAHQGIEIDGKICPVIHRDIKPANILIVTAPYLGEVVKILDFGIAKLVGDAAKLTQANSFLGSLAYCSPEQMEGRQLDNRSDIYSLGAVMFEMLTGESPWEVAGGNTKSYSLWYRVHHSQDPRDFKAAQPDLEIPPELEKLVIKCLAKEPSDRPSSVSEVLEALSEIEKQQATPQQRKSTSASQRRNGEKSRQKVISFEIKAGLFKFGFTDCHAVLGVPIDACPDTVHKRFRQLARILHPDSCKAQSQAEKDLAGALFAKLVGSAYTELSKPRKRDEYLVKLHGIGKEIALVASKFPLEREVAKQFYSSSGNLDQLYYTYVESLAAKQYESFDQVLEAIAILSELNVVYLMRKHKEKQENIGRETGETSGNTSNRCEEKQVESPCETYIRRAATYIANNNSAKAIVELRHALTIEPANSSCHSLLGMAYLKQEQSTMAKIHINKALQLNPHDARALQGKQMLDKLPEKAPGSKTTTPPTSSTSKSPDKSGGGLFGGLFGGKRK